MQVNRLSANDVALAGLKVLGLFLLLATIQSATALAAVRFGQPQGQFGDLGSYVFWTGLYTVASGAAALTLLFRTQAALRFVAGPLEESASVLASSKELVLVGLAVAGGVVGVRALPHVFYGLGEQMRLHRENVPAADPYVQSQRADLYFWGVSVAVGLVVARIAWSKLGSEVPSVEEPVTQANNKLQQTGGKPPAAE